MEEDRYKGWKADKIGPQKTPVLQKYLGEEGSSNRVLLEIDARKNRNSWKYRVYQFLGKEDPENLELNHEGTSWVSMDQTAEFAEAIGNILLKKI